MRFKSNVLPVAVIVLTLAALGSFAAESLFNELNLSGWTQMHGGRFYITNGAIRAEGGKGWLRTDHPFTNFVFEVESRGLETNYNSGIFVRAPLDGDPWATNIWQVNIKQSAIGELLEGSKKVVVSKIPPVPAGEWVKFRLEARGSKLQLAVNGEPAWEFDEFEPSTGYIGLQAEGKTVEFRRLKIQALP